MPSLYCLIHIASPKTPIYEVLEIHPKVWNTKWKHDDDGRIYNYRIEQCKHPDTPDATEYNTLVKFRFEKDQGMTATFNWFKERTEAEDAMQKELQDEKKEAEAKGGMFEWTVHDEEQEGDIVGGAKLVGQIRGRYVKWDIMEVKFEPFDSS